MSSENIKETQWAKRPVIIEGNKIRSIFDPWHSWQWYSPFDVYGRDREENLYMRFAALESDEEIKDFISNYGFLGLQESSLREVMIDDDIVIEETIDEIRFQISRMRIILNLQQAITEKKPLHSRDALNNLRELYKGKKTIIISKAIDQNNLETTDLERKWDVIKLDSHRTIVQEINLELQGVHQLLIYDVSAERYLQRWSIPTLLAAMYTMFSLDLQGGKILRKCANPTCPKYFEVYANDTRKIYHDPSCAALQAQRNFRRKKEQQKKEQTKG
ncbi:hypothetical protein [Desulfosporosinus sp. FKA]|uniref:hypothetical protein n=1 Tax=Desulfosporosinus sp. FKA TaxID=1969834 RepID=UPI000B4A00A8|nr:hypothetical protein [Desulfosporosinus sp. FKA]